MFLDNIDDYTTKADALKKIYSKNCPICKGEGLVKTNKGFTNCKCVTKANIHARLLCNGMPKKFLNINFNDIKNNVISNKLQNYCNDIETNIFEGNNLYIYGNNKVEMMKLDCAIANDLAFKKNSNGYYYNILIVSLEELTQTILTVRNTIELKNKLSKIMSGVDILILNYLGDESYTRTEQTAKYLTNSITDRSFNGKLTILSSTMLLDEILTKYEQSFVNTLKQEFKVLKLSEVEKIEENNIKENEFDEYYD